MLTIHNQKKLRGQFFGSLVGRSFFLLACAASVITCACFLYQYYHPSCFHCDDESYRLLSRFLIYGEPVSDRTYEIRTFGYPVFLIPFIIIGDGHRFFVAALIATGQFLLYLTSVYNLSRILYYYYSETVAFFASVGLLGNVFILPYLGISLTDGLSLVVALFVLSIILEILAVLNRVDWNKLVILAFGAGFLVGFGVIVRPGNIFWLPTCIVPLIYVAIWTKAPRIRRVLGLAAVFSFGFFLAIFPQLLLNSVVFHRHTFLPVYDLSAMQFDFGVRYLKYATHVTGIAPQMPYVNPWYHGAPNTLATLAWYAQNPIAGLRTVFYHIFGAIDFDYFFVYIYDANPWYRWILFAFIHTIVFWGSAGFVTLARTATKGKQFVHERLAVVLITIFVGSWTAVYMFSAVENRFALPIVALLGPLALIFLHKAIRRRLNALPLILSFIAYISVAGFLSHSLEVLRVGA